jgi:glycosyltransferase involved in cell wall biosynthesis
VTNIIAGHSCGIIIPEITPGEISQAIKLLCDNRGLLLTLKNNAKKASETLNWEKESGIAVEFYLKIIGASD